jgi:hypothetical protein
VKIVDVDGTVLDATFSISLTEGGRLSIAYESSGGRAGGPNPRNLDYRRGLSLLLSRLRELGALIDEIRVETERTRLLPIDQQRVQIEGRSFPLALASLDEVEDLRREISRYARKVGQSPDLAVQSGGSSRRLRIFVSGISLDPEALGGRVAGPGAQADATAVEAIAAIAAGRPRGGGKGFLVSRAVRRAVDAYAVAWAARHYASHGWIVEAVAGTESFDLYCARGPQHLHVHVKGTTTMGAGIVFTPSEVMHARGHSSSVELFLVSDIQISGDEVDHLVPGGGSARVWSPWVLQEDRLKPLGYEYTTSIGEEGTPVD